MANVIHRTTLQFLQSVNTPDYPEPTWKINPDMSAVVGVDVRYWKAPADWDAGGAGPEVQTAGEQTATDAAIATTLVASNQSAAVAEVDDESDPGGWRLRAIIEIFNKRDNYLVNRITELQDAMDAMKASTGGVANLRDAIPGAFLTTNTRARSAAVQDYRDEINSGGADS